MTYDTVDALVRELTDTQQCPWCGALLRGPVCTRCGVDLSGAAGCDLADRSRRAADALRERQTALRAIRQHSPSQAAAAYTPPAEVGTGPVLPVFGAPALPSSWQAPTPTSPAPPSGIPTGMPTGVPANAPASPSPLPAPLDPTTLPPPALPAAPYVGPSPVRRPGPRFTEASLPAVFGAVGAALVAVAGLVFAYSGLIADPAVRRAVLVLVTLGAGAGTLVLHRRRFGSSANAVGGLTAVLGLIAVHLVTGAAHGPAGQVALAGAGVAWAVVLAGAGRRLGLRAWSGAGLVIAPVAVTALGSVWDRWTQTASVAVGLTLLLAVVVAAGSAALERRWGGGRRTVESVALTVEAVVAVVVASVSGLVGTTELAHAKSSMDVATPSVGQLLLPGLTFVGLGLAAALLGRLRPGWWTWAAGTYLVGGAAWATMLAGGASGALSPLSVLGATTVTAALAWVVLSLVALSPPVRRGTPGRCRSLLAGGWLVTAVLAVPLGVTTLDVVGTALSDPFVGGGATRPAGQALASPASTSGWLPGAWLALGLVWAWYAVLPRVATAGPLSGGALPQGPPPDPADVLVTVRHPFGDVETPYATWVETGPGPRPLVYVVWARLRSTGEPVPLDRLDDPWRRGRTSLPGAAGALAPVLVGAALGTVGLIAGLPVGASLAVWLVSAASAWTADRALSRPGRARDGHAAAPVRGPWFTRFALRPGLWVSGLGLTVLAADYSWSSRPATLAVGLVVVAAAVAWSGQARSAFRPVLVGVGYAYALVVAGFSLSWYPWGWTASWPATAGSLAVVSAVVAVVLGRAHRRVGHPVYFTLLAVGAGPWLLAVTTMFHSRTWWAAVACTAILAVEAAVLSSRRRPQPAVVRIFATVGLVPTAAAVAVNVAPQLTDGSGAPAVLPVVAVLAVAGALVARPWAARLVDQQMDPALAARIRSALELSALATVVVAELLALVRPAAGAVVSLAVCAVVGAGSSYLATRPDRRAVWWLAWLAWSGVLWSALGLGGVTLVEAYTAPPTLVASVIAFWFVPRGRPMVRLGGIGTLLTLGPTLALALGGQAVAVRAGVLAAAAVFLGVSAVAVRRGTRAAVLPWAAAGIATGALGPFVLACHGLGVARGAPTTGDPWLHDTVARMTPTGQFLAVVVVTLVAAVLMGWAGLAAGWAAAGRPSSRTVATWRLAGAAALVAAGPLLAAGVPDAGARTWPLLATWLVGAVLMLGGVVAARRAAVADHLADGPAAAAPDGPPHLSPRPGVLGLPPTWFWWLLAFVVFVPYWSTGRTVVEWYTLPQVVAVLAAAVTLLRTPEERGDGQAPTPPAHLTTSLVPTGGARSPSSRLARVYGVGVPLGLAPTLLLLVGGQAVTARTTVLVTASVLLGAGALVARRTYAPLLPWVAAGAAVGALGPFVLACHGLVAARHATHGSTGDRWFYDAVTRMAPTGQFLTTVALSLLAAALMGWAGLAAGWVRPAADLARVPTTQPTAPPAAQPAERLAGWFARWRFAGAVVLVATGTVLATSGLDRSGAPVLPLVVTWLLGAALVLGGSVSLVRTGARKTGLPPAWFWWPLAYLVFVVLWVTGTVAVEWYALPYGAAMFASGWAVVRRAPGASARPGPTAVLAPTVVAVLAPSTLTLFADPATWRAIMLVLLALGFMLLGARKMWKALLGLGIADMAVVVVVVFATAQVSTTPWLITLLAVGGLLLTLAVYAERRRNAAVTD